VEARGIIDHGFIHSIYFRDPNGYVIELTARAGREAGEDTGGGHSARATLDRWQAAKAPPAASPAPAAIRR
jgi:catechol-2,3-dioxygenase